MKVLIWTQYFWPENFHINTIARGLSEQGLEVTVLTGKPNYPDGEIYPGYKAAGVQRQSYLGFDVIRIPMKGRGKPSATGLALNYLSFIVSGYLFAPFALRGKQFDVVFVFAPSPLLQALPAIFLAWLKRAPLVLWVQDLWPEALLATRYIKRRWILSLVGLVVRYIYRFSDSILIPSEGFRGSVERLSNCREKIRFFPNSAEGSGVEPAMARRDECVAEGVGKFFSIVFAGNIGTAQSCETIIEAAKLLQGVGNVKFYLIGSGSMAGVIRQSIEDKKLSNVEMKGQVSPSEMASIFVSASVLLMSLGNDPSLSATIPSKLQAYMAAGKPIIASSNGDSAEVVRIANAGLVCRACDAEALAKAVLRLYEMRAEERERLGENGRKYFMAKYFLPDRVAELVAHFKVLLTSR